MIGVCNSTIFFFCPAPWDPGEEPKGMSVRPSVRLSVTLSPPKPLDEIQPNFVCELLT